MLDFLKISQSTSRAIVKLFEPESVVWANMYWKKEKILDSNFDYDGERMEIQIDLSYSQD
jgi:hypothetical protein